MFNSVQLAPNIYGELDLGTPKIRWHQTADQGIVPNEHQQNTFMAVAIDTYDEESPSGSIHPRYKQIVAERLALAGLNIAYQMDEFPTNGPFIMAAEIYASSIMITLSQVNICASKRFDMVIHGATFFAKYT